MTHAWAAVLEQAVAHRIKIYAVKVASFGKSEDQCQRKGGNEQQLNICEYEYEFLLFV